jgi:hypothetical protein
MSARRIGLRCNSADTVTCVYGASTRRLEPNTSATIPEVTTPGDLGDEITAFLRSMRRENVSPNTIATYGTACRIFAEWLMERG